jgi:hypothetical protein
LHPRKALVAKKVVRIVFTIKHKEASSAFVDQERFDALQLPSFSTENQHTAENNSDAAEEKMKAPREQMSKFVPANHSSTKKRRLAEAAAATASQSVTSPSKVVDNSQRTLTRQPTPKRKRTLTSTNQSVKPEAEPSVVGAHSESVAGANFVGDKVVLLPQPGASIERAGGKTLIPSLDMTAPIGSMGGKSPFPPQPETATDVESMGEKTMFTSQLSAQTDTAAVGGKTIFLPPAPPYRKKKASQSNSSSRKVGSAILEGSESIATPPKAQSKPRRNSVSSTGKTDEETENVEARPKTQPKLKRNSISVTNQSAGASEEPEKAELPPKTQAKLKKGLSSSKKGGNTMSERSEKAEDPAKRQPPRKRESVSSRELRGLLDPYKSATGIDTSFGVSFDAEPKKARSLRRFNPVYALPQVPGPSVSSMQGGLSDPPPVLTPAKDVYLMIRRKSSGSREKPVFPNLFATTKDTAEPQIDHSTAKLVSEAIQLEKKPSTSSSESKPSNMRLATTSNEVSQPAAEATNRSIDAINETHNALKAGDEKQKQVTPLGNNPSDLSSQATPLDRPSRSYSVDSEGKKIPTPRNDSLPELVQSPPTQAKGEPSTPMPQQPPASSSVSVRRSSLSQVLRETPEMTTAPRRELPAASSSVPERRSSLSIVLLKTPTVSTASRRKLTATLPAKQNSESSTRELTTRIAAPAQTPKVSVSETFTFSTPAPAATASARIRTPASQSSARNKRNAAEISSPFQDSSATSTRLWKPTSMCDGSVLGYASGEAWPGTSIDPVSKNVCRTIKAEREGVFRASGVLMGVRFVVGLV